MAGTDGIRHRRGLGRREGAGIDAGDDQRRAQQFGPADAFAEDEDRGQKREDQFHLADGAHIGHVLHGHGREPADRAEHRGDAHQRPLAPVLPDFGQLAGFEYFKINRHHHGLDGQRDNQCRGGGQEHVIAAEGQRRAPVGDRR